MKKEKSNEVTEQAAEILEEKIENLKQRIKRLARKNGFSKKLKEKAKNLK